jgi:hypothetical protein
MANEVATEEVGQVESGENVDSMPEETPDQAPVETAEPAEPPPVEGAPPAFSMDGLDASQVEGWKKDSENRHNWQATNTQEAQRISEERKALAYQQNQMQAFQNDPVTQEILAARQRIEQNPELLAGLSRFNAETAQPGTQPDPLVNKLFGQVQTLTEQMRQNQWQAEEQARGEAALAAKTQVETFREAHQMTDEQFTEFYQNVYVPTGVADLETAWKISDYDNAQARARQGAQTEVEAVEGEKREAAGTVVPGSHTPEVTAGNPWDTEFRGARERSMSRYDLGLSED